MTDPALSDPTARSLLLVPEIPKPDLERPALGWGLKLQPLGSNKSMEASPSEPAASADTLSTKLPESIIHPSENEGVDTKVATEPICVEDSKPTLSVETMLAKLPEDAPASTGNEAAEAKVVEEKNKSKNSPVDVPAPVEINSQSAEEPNLHDKIIQGVKGMVQKLVDGVTEKVCKEMENEAQSLSAERNVQPPSQENVTPTLKESIQETQGAVKEVMEAVPTVPAVAPVVAVPEVAAPTTPAVSEVPAVPNVPVVTGPNAVSPLPALGNNIITESPKQQHDPFPEATRLIAYFQKATDRLTAVPTVPAMVTVPELPEVPAMVAAPVSAALVNTIMTDSPKEQHDPCPTAYFQKAADRTVDPHDPIRADQFADSTRDSSMVGTSAGLPVVSTKNELQENNDQKQLPTANSLKENENEKENSEKESLNAAAILQALDGKKETAKTKAAAKPITTPSKEATTAAAAASVHNQSEGVSEWVKVGGFSIYYDEKGHIEIQIDETTGQVYKQDVWRWKQLESYEKFKKEQATRQAFREYCASAKRKAEDHATNWRMGFDTSFVTCATIAAGVQLAYEGKSLLGAGACPLAHLGGVLLIDALQNNNNSYLMPDRLPAKHVHMATAAAIATGGIAIANKCSPYESLMAASLVGIAIPYALLPLKSLSRFINKKFEEAN